MAQQQQQQQQPKQNSTNQQADQTFQQQLQQQQEQQQQQQIQSTTFVNPCNSSASSPRRRKPPLDLDTALYLQSQASYVQEPFSRPASSNSSGGGAGSACSNVGLCADSATNLAQTGAINNCPGANRLLAHSPTRSKSQTANTETKFDFLPCSSCGSAPARPASQQQQNYDYFSGNNHHNYHYYNSVNNISVDYIDCLSNNDLTSNLQPQQHQQGSPQEQPLSVPRDTSRLRNMLRCRKHFRFNRNRIEPDAGEPGASKDPSNLQAAAPATPSAMNDAGSSDATNSSSGDTNSVQATAESLSNNMIAGSNNINDNNNNNNNNNISPSVLYPIAVSEAKKRTYFIGSVSQDSLLGPDELYRYFPNGRVSIFVCTWNQNRKRAPMNLNDLLLPDQLIYMPDIYAIGIQEAFSSQNDYLRDWEIELQTTLGPNHVLLHSCSLGVLHLSLFVRRDLIWFCSVPEESVYNSRSMPTNMIKTKGAVSIAFRFFGTSFMFTNCHFPAHENKVKDRIDEYQRIINSIDLPKNLKLLKPRYLSNDSTARFDCVFFMGDLNFRLEQRTFDETIHILEDIFQQREPSYETLTQNDELLKVMETNQAFHGFDEPQIKFPPTYKFLAQTNKYDKQTKRVPSYTDRILFRSKRQRHIQCLAYDWLPQLLSSDHKPVYCLFEVLVRPGHEQNLVGNLNAGLFQRSVYLEALKRHAEDPDALRENGASGNVICSIS